MIKRLILINTLIFILLSCQIQCSKNDVIFQKNIMIPMSDGMQLATNITRPAAGGKYPIILVRTPYGKDNES